MNSKRNILITGGAGFICSNFVHYMLVSRKDLELLVNLDELTYDEVLARHLKATDTTAMTLAMDNHMTMVCFGLADPQNIFRVVCGEKIGTTVKED